MTTSTPPPFPPKGLIVETAFYDGSSWVVLMCARCKHYGYYVSTKIATGGLNVSKRRITLAELNRLEGEHRCPPAVIAAAEGTSDTRPAAELSTDQLRDGANHQDAGAHR
jgi:hypothetical protein